MLIKSLLQKKCNFSVLALKNTLQGQTFAENKANASS
jgi:hypothetical protein